MSALRSAPEPLLDAEWLEWSSPVERGRARAWWAVVGRPLQTLAGYLMVSPAIVTIVLFSYLPALLLFSIAFFHYQLRGASSPFVGFHEFDLVFNQPLFWKSILNTLYFVGLTVPATVFPALGLALFLREGVRQARSGFGRSMVFLPHITPVIATSIIWIWIFNPQFGIANYALHLFGVPTIRWLDSTTWAMPSIMIYSVWHAVGLNTVLFLGGLAGIDERMLEAARVAGARGAQLFRRVIWPLLSPMTFYVVLTTFIGNIQAFGVVYALSGGERGGAGGPANATLTDSLLIYKTAFRYFHYSLAAAMSLLLFGFLIFMAVVQKQLSKRWVFYR